LGKRRNAILGKGHLGNRHCTLKSSHKPLIAISRASQFLSNPIKTQSSETNSFFALKTRRKSFVAEEEEK
jgi:hypothetical protein